jgi:hypothetical protein
MDSPEQEDEVFELAAQQTVDLANRIADEYPDADLWDVASGILAGAVQYWLYSRQPCGDPFCDACAEVSTAEQRMRSLLDEVRESARESDYYHTPRDSNVGTA